MIFELRNALESVLEERKTKNSSYSLRAFARDLEISPAYLSLILNNKVEVKKDKFVHIINKLFTDPEKQKYWLDQINQISERYFYKGHIPHYQNLRSKIKMTWAHYAILEVFNLSDFEYNSKWMESRVGIQQERIEIIIDELFMIGALEDINGEVQSRDLSFTNIKDGTTSNDRKTMQKEILEKSIAAIDKIDITERDHTSMTIAIDKSNIDLVKKRIKEFRRELCCELANKSRDKSDSVYQLQFSFFSLGEV